MIKPLIFKKPFAALFMSLLLGLSTLLGIPKASSSEVAPNSPPLIAITQITSHETLDKIYRGVVDGLKEKGYTDGKGAKLLSTNAHGDIGTAVQIAQKFVAEKPAVIIAIATPSAQAVAKAISGTNLQLVFSGITDPITAGLVTNYQHPGGNITGTLSSSPIAEQIAIIHESMPELKTLGMVLNFGEQNSVDLLSKTILAAQDYHIKVIPVEANSSADVATATKSLVGKVQAIILIQDNTVASALPSLLQVTNDHRIPTFAVFTEAIEQGATMEVAYDAYDIGVQTGYLAARILGGELAGSIEVVDPHKLVIRVNKRMMEQFNIKIPERVLEYL